MSSKGVKRSVKVEPGQLIMSICATIGKPIIVGFPCCIHDGFVLFDEPSSDVDTEFLFYQLLKNQAEIVRNRQIGTQGNLNTTLVNDIELLNPPKDEQVLIANILDTLDTAIRQTEALIEKLKQIKQGLLHDLLTRGIDANGELRPPPEIAPELYKKSALGLIPKEWETRCLESCAAISSGVTMGRSLSGVGAITLPYLRVANVQDGYLDLSEIKTVQIFPSELARFRLESGDVLMNEGGDFDKLGRGTVWEGQIENCLHQNHVFKVRCNPGLLNPYYLEFYSASVIGKAYFVQASKQTTNLASINSTQLKAFTIALPQVDEQRKIVDQMQVFQARFTNEMKRLDKLRQQKSALMDDLLTGRVRVTPLLSKAETTP